MSENEEKKDLGTKIITTGIALAAIAIVIVASIIINKTRPDNADQPEPTATNQPLIDLGSDSVQSVHLLNSDKLVYINGIDAETAANIEAVFQYYESDDDNAEDTVGSLANIYAQIEPQVTEWFDPQFDLIAAFNAIDHPADGPDAWLANPLAESLAEGNSTDIFYFRQREDGDYEMSAAYYLLGCTYANMVHPITTETEGE